MDAGGNLSRRKGRAVKDKPAAPAEPVTDRDAHRRLAEKMEAVGMLARGIAHDFNNILSGILGFTSYLKTKAQPGTDLHRDLSLIEQSGARAAELTNQLFLIARRRHFSREPVDINSLIEEVLALLQPTLGSAIAVRRRLKLDLPAVPGDSAHLKQTILNLCMNAADAMAEHGGTLTVSSACRMLEPHERSVLDLAPDAKYVCVGVTDTGREIDADLLKHVFDPFYPVRSRSGKGNLLLSIVYGIVLNHYGDILAESSAEHGTTFRMFLPVAAHDDKKEGEPAPLGGTETVLVVDDEAIVCQVVGDILKMHGYKVVTSASGADALDILRASKEKIDMVLLDLVMPGMSGEEVFHAMQKLDPKLPVLLTSITAQEALGERLIASGARGIVYKPYKSSALLKAVRDALDKAAKPKS